MKNVVVLASAGTGKTWTLVQEYLLTLLGLVDETSAPCRPDELLAITFTDKAAAEMRARVQAQLAQLIYDPAQHGIVRASALRLGRALPDARSLEALRRMLPHAPVGTFHAFCGRLLREHAFAAGLDPDFAILQPDDERRLLLEVAESVVLDALAQQDAVAADLVARIALRGLWERAGLVEALAAVWTTLAERGLDPAGLPLTAPVLGVDDAVHQLQGALEALRVGAAGQSGQSGQFGQSGSAVRVGSVAQHLEAFMRVRAAPTGALEDEETAVARSFVDLRDAAAGNWGGTSLAELRRGVVDAIDALGASLVDHFTADLAPGVRDLLVELDERQRREKDERGVLGFGDMLVRARDLLRDDKSVRARVKSRFVRVFVDEYQDTSPVQEQILALLLEDKSRGDALGIGPPLPQLRIPAGRAFLVGDPKQGIYGFRGADEEVFARALDGLARSATGELLGLRQSRRSTAGVCAFVNLVGASTLPSYAEEALTPLLDDEIAGTAGERWRLPASPMQGPSGRVLPAVEREALTVARRLRSLVDEGRHRPRDVAVLVRRGRACVPVGRALARLGVPARVIGGDGFFVRPEVLDIVSALALVVDPGDELAVWAVLRSPLVAVPDDQILALYEALPDLRGGLSWPRVVQAAGDDLVQPDVRARVRAFDALLGSIRARLVEQPLTAALDALLDQGGYAAAAAVESDGILRLRHLEKLRALCVGPLGEGLNRISRLLAALDDPPPEPVLYGEIGDDAVSVMTIHQAKGLEFAAVVLADASSSLRVDSADILFDPAAGLAVSPRGRPVARCAPKPSSIGPVPALARVRRARRQRDERELARLLYVALTRAKQAVYIVGEPKKTASSSLLSLIEGARARGEAAFDVLLPTVVVDAAVPPPPSGPDRERPVTTADMAASVPPPAPQSAPRHGAARVSASQLVARADPQLSMGLRVADEVVEDLLPPRAAGRLAHAIIALVATEQPEVLTDSELTRKACIRAARALQALDTPDEIYQRCTRTLCGPLRKLIDEGRILSFEESLVLVTGEVVVEGTADLVARGKSDVVVVEMKLSARAADADATRAQLFSYAAALEQRGWERVRVAAWAIGDEEPVLAVPWGKPARRQLALWLAQIHAHGL